jgi:hypothetical protein
MKKKKKKSHELYEIKKKKKKGHSMIVYVSKIKKKNVLKNINYIFIIRVF